MKAFGWSLLILATSSASAIAAIGDQWILGIRQLDGSFTRYTGAGYGGPQSSGGAEFVGNAYGFSGNGHNANKIHWELSGLSTNTNQPVPTRTQLYSVEFYGTLAQPGSNNWQQIEVDWNGSAPGNGEAQIDPNIPWVGQSGTNHQWIGADAINGSQVGQWITTGPGPQAPESEAYLAEGFGTHMWMTRNSWLYTKWNSGFPVNRAWTAIRVTQVSDLGLPGDHDRDEDVDISDYVVWRGTNIDGANGYTAWSGNYGAGQGTGTGFAVPEPAAATLLLVGLIGLLLGRTRICGEDRQHQLLKL